MSTSELLVFDTPQLLAAAVADAFVQDAAAAIEERGTFFVSLAGGTTPKAAYTLLAQEPRVRQVEWENVQVFFGDERCVAPDNPDSNYRMARESFLDAVGIPANNVHRMEGEADPATGAADYAQLLIHLLGPAPRFDLIMLGMGPDGHTASLFPGSDPRTDEGRLVRAVYVEKMHAHRITLTPAVINNSRHVVIATEGEGKAAALHNVRKGPQDPILFPVLIVAPADGRLTWMVDRAAAGFA